MKSTNLKRKDQGCGELDYSSTNDGNTNQMSTMVYCCIMANKALNAYIL